MVEACLAATARPFVEFRCEQKDRGGPPRSHDEPEGAAHCPCCGTRMARKDPPPDHVGRIAVGVILAVVGFGTGAAALFVGRAPGVFTASAMSLMLIAAGAALFLWGLASILGHPPRTWRCPYCGFRRELR